MSDAKVGDLTVLAHHHAVLSSPKLVERNHHAPASLAGDRILRRRSMTLLTLPDSVSERSEYHPGIPRRTGPGRRGCHRGSRSARFEDEAVTVVTEHRLGAPIRPSICAPCHRPPARRRRGTPSNTSSAAWR